MIHNICHYVPTRRDDHTLRVIHFVRESNPDSYPMLRTEAVYKMYYVCTGKGRLHVRGAVHPLQEGDVFFTFPSAPFRIESTDGLVYMYISFVGLRGNQVMERVGVTSTHFLFHDNGELYAHWLSGLSLNGQVSDLASESVLMYTFAFLGNKRHRADTVRSDGSLVARMQKVMDENYCIADFSLETLSRELSYSPKYLSTVFKRQMGVGVVEYLHALRLRRACTMMEQGYTSISDVANACGFADPQYFSKVFKGKLGQAPGAYIKALRERKEQPE